MKCDACLHGDHANCGMQTWCDCEDERDGVQEAGSDWSEWDAYEEDGPLDLEDQLENAVERGGMTSKRHCFHHELLRAREDDSDALTDVWFCPEPGCGFEIDKRSIETTEPKYRQQCDMAFGWIEVCKQLTYHNKEWVQQTGTGVDCALQEIRRLQALEKTLRNRPHD